MLTELRRRYHRAQADRYGRLICASLARERDLDEVSEAGMAEREPLWMARFRHLARLYKLDPAALDRDLERVLADITR